MPLFLFFLLAFQIPSQDPVYKFAQDLITANSEKERQSLLEQNKPLINVPLREALLKEASALTQKGEYARSRAICDLVLQITDSIHDRKGEASAWNVRGLTYRGEENYEEAEKHFKRSMTISESIQDQEQYALAVQNMGRIASEQQKYEEALRHYEKTIDLFKDIKNVQGEARSYNLMANVYDYQGNPKRALELYEQSLKLLEQIQDTGGIAGVLVNRGTVYADMGRNDLAIDSYRRAEKVFEERGEKPHLAIVLSNTGNSFSDMGNYRLALQYHIRALKIREELGTARGIASSTINIGYIHEKQGSYDLALDLYLRAHALVKKAEDKYLEGITLTNVGGIYALTERYEAGLEYFEKARVLREEISDKSGVGSVFYAIAGTNELMGRYDKAIEYYQKTLQVFEELNMKARIAEALLGFSTVHLALNNLEESERYAALAHEAARELDFPDLMWAILSQQGKILFHKGNHKEAEAVLTQSIEVVESLRQNVVGSETANQQFLTTRKEPFYLMVELLAQQNRDAEAFQFAERIKGRVLLDVLQSGRVEVTKHMSVDETKKEQDLTSDLMIVNAMLGAEKAEENPNRERIKDLSAQVQNARMALEAFHANLYAIHPILKTHRADISLINSEKIAALLDSGEAFLEYSVAKNQTFLFVWTDKNSESPQLHVIRIPVRQKVISELTKTYRQQLAKRDLRAAQTGQKLYDILLMPAEKYFAAQKTLLIIPDQELWELPFQALQGAGGHALLERFSISYVSSLSILYEMKKSEEKSHSDSVLLALGSSIPHAETEVNALAQFYGKTSRIYTGRKAQESILKKEASKFEIIHVATHGVLDNASPMYSYLTLAPEENEDGLLEPQEVMNLNLNSALVVLSACETGGGKIGAGEGMIGFTWAFFVAGSPSTVVSQWKVDSESTAALMLEFHRNLKVKKFSKAEALRQAALKLRQDSRYRHPYYWAGFIVVGDPSPI